MIMDLNCLQDRDVLTHDLNGCRGVIVYPERYYAWLSSFNFTSFESRNSLPRGRTSVPTNQIRDNSALLIIRTLFIISPSAH